MLAALMVDGRIAFILAALTAIAASFTVEGDLYLFAFYFISGIVGLHGMIRILDRRAILRAGLVVGLVNMLSIAAIKMALGQLTSLHEFYEVGLGFLGGVLSSLLVSGISPLLEPLGYTTNIKLLELANLNHPLLKEMAQEAPRNIPSLNSGGKSGRIRCRIDWGQSSPRKSGGHVSRHRQSGQENQGLLFY